MVHLTKFSINQCIYCDNKTVLPQAGTVWFFSSMCSQIKQQGPLNYVRTLKLSAIVSGLWKVQGRYLSTHKKTADR